MTSYIDERGRTWHKFSLEYRHEIDDMTFSIEIWAIYFADAEERLQFIKQNGKIYGRILCQK